MRLNKCAGAKGGVNLGAFGFQAIRVIEFDRLKIEKTARRPLWHTRCCPSGCPSRTADLTARKARPNMKVQYFSPTLVEFECRPFAADYEETGTFPTYVKPLKNFTLVTKWVGQPVNQYGLPRAISIAWHSAIVWAPGCNPDRGQIGPQFLNVNHSLTESTPVLLVPAPP